MAEGQIVFDGATSKGLPVVLRYPAGKDVQPLWEQINVLSQERTYLLFQGEAVTLDDETTWLARKLQEIEHGEAVMLLAVASDGTLMGNAEIRLGSGVKRHVGVFGIALAQMYRGHGVGELLMRTVIDETVAKIRRLEIVTLEVFGNNTVGQQLYKKMGFAEYGRLPGGMIHRERAIDEVLMYKVVRAGQSE